MLIDTTNRLDGEQRHMEHGEANKATKALYT